MEEVDWRLDRNSLVTGEAWVLPETAATWAVFIYLIFVGSVLLFYLFLYVLAIWRLAGSRR